MLKILSFLPFACLTKPIFSSKIKSSTLRFIISETRKPEAYNNEIINLLFFVSQLLRSFFTSFFVKTVGIFFSRFGLLIEMVGSDFRIFEYAYLIAERKRIIDVAARSESFSARNNLTSSSVISLGDLFVKDKSELFALR